MNRRYRVVAKSSAYEQNPPVKQAFGAVDDPQAYESREAAEDHAEELSDTGERNVYLQGANSQDETDVDAYLVSRNPPEHRFETVRKDILERDSYTCQECGVQGSPGDGTLDVHHITPRSQGGSNDPENLQTLCGDCHRFLHAEEARRGTVQELREIVKRHDEWHIQPADLQDRADDYTDSPRFSGVGRKLGRLAERWDSLIAIRTADPALYIYTGASIPSEHGIPNPEYIYPVIGYWDTPRHDAVDPYSGSQFDVTPTPLYFTDDADDGPARIFPKNGFSEPPVPENLFVCGQCGTAVGYAHLEQANTRARFRNQAPPRAEQRRQHKAYFCEERPPLPDLLEDSQQRAAFSRALVEARDPDQVTHVEQVIAVLRSRRAAADREERESGEISAAELINDVDDLDTDAIKRALYCIRTAERGFLPYEGSVTNFLNLSD